MIEQHRKYEYDRINRPLQFLGKPRLYCSDHQQETFKIMKMVQRLNIKNSLKIQGFVLFCQKKVRLSKKKSDPLKMFYSTQ